LNVRVQVLSGELSDEGVKPLVISLDGDGGEEGLDVLSGGGGLSKETNEGEGKREEVSSKIVDSLLRRFRMDVSSLRGKGLNERFHRWREGGRRQCASFWNKERRVGLTVGGWKGEGGRRKRDQL